MRARRWARLGGLVVALAAAAVPADASAAVRWRACGSGVQCGRVLVPLDHARPDGPRISIALARVPASRPATRIGTLIVNPGGPGGSGVQLARHAAQVFSRPLRERFDIVGFDPRGVGRSTAMRCPGRQAAAIAGDFDPTPDTRGGRAAILAAFARLGRSCRAASGALLAHVDTNSAAEDIERIRAALGEEKISYLGFSYGTLLGAAYADRHPDRVRAFVLDGAVDPALSATELNLQQARAFERELQAFLRWCAGSRGCAFAGGRRPGRVLDAFIRRVDRKPLRVGRRSVGEATTVSAIANALYNREAWDVLADALADAVRRRDAEGLLRLGSVDDEQASAGPFFAVNCLDRPAPAAGSLAALERRFARVARHFGPTNFYTLAACTRWPVRAVGVPAPYRAVGAPPILVVGTTGDPATPYGWSRSLASQLASGVLLTRIGHGHTGYGSNTCIDAAVDTYLVDARPPRSGTVCRAG